MNNDMRIEFYPYPFLTGLLILVLVILIRWHSKHSWLNLIFASLFGLYFLAVVNLILFPLPLPVAGEWRQPVSAILARVNLIPFNFGGLFDLHPNIAIYELGGNILLTVPFGFPIPLLTRVKPPQILWLSLLVGLSTELAQLVTCLIIGRYYRSVDINDVLLNALGALIGSGLFVVTNKAIKILSHPETGSRAIQ